MLRLATVALLTVALLTAGADGHGMMVFPPSRNAFDRFLPQFRNGQSPQTPCTCPNSQQRDHNGDHGSSPCEQGNRSDADGQPCLWWSQGCTIGCDTCTGILKGGRQCSSTLEPTLPKRFWTMNVNGTDSADPAAHDTYRYFPWRAPGMAPVADPCGMAGGTDPKNGHGGDAVFTTTSYAKMGDLGSKVLPYAPSGTKWMVGEGVEVGFGITYNHGGGYQYRLCKLPAKNEALTEHCFQQTPLEFVRTKQALLLNNGTRWPLPGMFINEGTWPKNST
jgi:hypothetical protein